MRCFLELSYDGGSFHGWQRQPGCRTVQETVEEALSRLLRAPAVAVVGCGRTDTGVHADYFVAHFDAPEGTEATLTELLAEERRTLFRLNGILPADVAASSLQSVDERLHSRFSARERTYRYRLCLDKRPLLRAYTMRPLRPLDFARMNEAADALLGEHDFTSFSKTGTQTKTNLCTVTRAEWEQVSAGRVDFVISADRFLRNMVRAVVGTLFEVGLGKMPPDEVREVMSRRDRCAAGTSVAARALALVDVRYDPGCSFHTRRSAGEPFCRIGSEQEVGTASSGTPLNREAP